jgi:enamine deaminase RidA (YjgF/YER057c/UK114 family)
VFTAGAVPLDPDGRLVGPGDRSAQAGQVLANPAEVLHAAGSGLEHIVASTVYVVAANEAAQAELSEVWKVVRARGPGLHTSTLLGVECLGYAGQLVEIMAVAVVP